MKINRNIYLIGPQGAGKTTIGRKLAKMAHLVFYDSDHEIEKKTGVSISTIFAIESESGFRKREEEMIAQLTQLDNIVLSTGGGTILSSTNRHALTQNGMIIYLCASLDTQLNRTNQRKGMRPLLDTPDPFKKIIELDQERRPLYESIATYTFDTDVESPNTIVDQIIEKFLT